jgi:hypothetical protein
MKASQEERQKAEGLVKLDRVKRHGKKRAEVKQANQSDIGSIEI